MEIRSSQQNILNLRAEAKRLFQAQEFESALDLYRELSAGNPYDGELKLQLARCAARTDRPELAIEAATAALETGCTFPWEVQYEVARLYAMAGDKEACLIWLEKSLSTRWEDRPAIMTDEAFAPFHGDPHFLRLAGALTDAEIERVAGWGIDLDHLVAEAQRLHPDPDRPAFSDEFLSLAASLRTRIPFLTNEAIVVEMQRLVARLGDGHSAIHPTPTAKVQLVMLPVDFYLFSDGLFIIGGSGDAARYIGGRVLQIGSRPIDAVIADAADLISADNAMTVKWMLPLYLTLPACLQALDAADSPTAATLTIEDRSGKIQQVSLSGGTGRLRQKLWPSRLSQNPPPLYLRDTGRNFWLEKIAELNTIYVQYNQVRDMENQSVAEFAAQLFETIRTTRPKTLIVDVRHNNGGNNFLNWPLIRTLIHFETNSSDNQIFVLIGRNTFSACQNFVNWLERMTAAVFVGEPTSSRPNVIGESTNVVLPYSGVRAGISSRIHYDSFWGDHRPWIAPQVPVEFSSEAYFSNQDPVLDTVLALIA